MVNTRVFWPLHAVLASLILLVGLEWFFYTQKREAFSRLLTEVYQIKEELRGCAPQDITSRMRADLRQLGSAIEQCKRRVGVLQRLKKEIEGYQSPALTLMEKVKDLEKGVKGRYPGQPIPENLGFPDQLPENQDIVYLFYHLKLMERILPALYAGGGYLSNVRMGLSSEDRYPLELDMVLPMAALMDVYKELLKDPVFPIDSEDITSQDEEARLLLVKMRFLPYYDLGGGQGGERGNAVPDIDQ